MNDETQQPLSDEQLANQQLEFLSGKFADVVVGYYARERKHGILLHIGGEMIIMNSGWGIKNVLHKLGVSLRGIDVLPISVTDLYQKIQRGEVIRYRVGKLRFGDLSARVFYDIFFRHMECDEHINKGLFRLRWNPDLEPRLPNLERYACT